MLQIEIYILIFGSFFLLAKSNNLDDVSKKFLSNLSLAFNNGMRYTRCSSIDQLTKSNCTFEQQCIGYMGTTKLVLNGYCVPLRTKSEVCGTVRAPSPNDKHKVYLGHCAKPNTCIKNKFVCGETINCDPHHKTLKRGGYHCNGSCINNNIEYHNWSLAWNRCKELAACTRIFRWENGSHYNYYLRKVDDVFDNNKRYLHVDFDSQCRA